MKKRRVLYFQNLMRRSKESLMFSFLKTQILHPDKGDWYLQVKQDLKDFSLPDDLRFYENIKEEKFKEIVKDRSKDSVLEKFLMMKKLIVSVPGA